METIEFHYLTIKQLPDVYQFYLGAVCAFFGIIGVLNAIATCAIVYKLSKENEILRGNISAKGYTLELLFGVLTDEEAEKGKKGGNNE